MILMEDLESRMFMSAAPVAVAAPVPLLELAAIQRHIHDVVAPRIPFNTWMFSKKSAWITFSDFNRDGRVDAGDMRLYKMAMYNGVFSPAAMEYWGKSK